MDEKIFYHDIVESILAALGARDTFTAEHSIRVGNMTQQLCFLLGVAQDKIEIYHMAAHVHDIGKIGISDAILNKPGKLLQDEWEQIRKHPRIGAEILGKSKNLKEIADIVLHHHERWDGLGYPDGLQGTDIPFGSRVIAVCDSIDAMKSQRAYRAPLSDETCHAEIEKNIGIMYDPRISVCALEHWNAFMHGYVRAANRSA